MKRTGLLLGLLLILGVASALIISKEHTLTGGQRVLLQLRPIDPRSLMQGDYMILNYAITGPTMRSLSVSLSSNTSKDGLLRLEINPNGVAHSLGLDTGQPLEPGQIRLRYRWRKDRMRFGAEAFFFQEGHGPIYETAEYGELRVTPSGDSVLVGLCDADRQPLGPQHRIHGL